MFGFEFAPSPPPRGWLACLLRPPPPPPPPPIALLPEYAAPLLALLLAIAMLRIIHSCRIGAAKRAEAEAASEAERRRLFEQAAARRARLESRRAKLAEQRCFTLADLRRWDGSDEEEDEPVLLLVDGHVYDVADGREHYGVGRPYHDMTGRDASRFLARGLLTEETEEEARKPLTKMQEMELAGWVEHFEYKYKRLRGTAPGAAAGGWQPP
jgi:predicted heme/steroid binding protein